MKKFLSLVLALIMTMSLVTISAGATEYKDLTDKDEIEYEEAVAVLNRIGVITGYDDGSFRPETELTRGAAAKIIVSLLIGPEAANNLPNTTAPYPDVPASHTFAGVISYCKTAGIISGYGDGTFKPANSLTGFAFAKMLLGALGYNSQVEGFVDTGWTMNVAKVGNVTGLFDRLDFDGAGAVSREVACQLALNTLKATMVTYGGTTVVTGAQTLAVQGTQAMYVTSNNRDINANINRRVISATNNELTLEFGEEHFKDLRLEHDRYDPAYDIYGHPSNEWSYKKVTIGTFKLPADFTYTKQMAHIEDTVATKEKALDLRGYDTYSTDHRGGYVNWSTAASNTYGNSPFADATQIHINGWKARVWNDDYKQTAVPKGETVKGDGNWYSYDAFDIGAANKDLAPSLSEICDLTDNGVTVEVYVCPVDADFITDVVVTRTQLMEVDRVASDFVDLAAIDSDSKDPRKAGTLTEIAGYNDYSLFDEVSSVKDNNYDPYNVLKDLKAGDEVAVIPYTADDGKTWEVGEAYVPETVSGALTNVNIYNTRSKADGNAIEITVGGTTYPIAQWNLDMREINTTKIRATKKDVTLVLDKDGNALRAKDVGASDDWIIVGDYYQATLTNGRVGWYVHGWTIKGNEVDLELGTIRGAAEKYAPGELVKYQVASAGNGEYELVKPMYQNPKGVGPTDGRRVLKNGTLSPWVEPMGAVVTDNGKKLQTGEGVYNVAQYARYNSETNQFQQYEINSRNTLIPLEFYDTDRRVDPSFSTATGVHKDYRTANSQTKVDAASANYTDGLGATDSIFYTRTAQYNTWSYRTTPYDGVKFIFVGFDSGSGEVDTINVLDGVQNVKYDELIQINRWWRNVGTNNDSFVASPAEAYVDKNGKVKAVVIKSDSAEANLKDLIIITDNRGTYTKNEGGAEAPTASYYRTYQYVTGEDGFKEEKTGYFDRDLDVGTVLIGRLQSNGVFKTSIFHKDIYEDRNPDGLYVKGIKGLYTQEDKRSDWGFYVGDEMGIGKAYSLGTGIKAGDLMLTTDNAKILTNTDVLGLNGETTKKGLIRVDSNTQFLDLRDGRPGDITELGDLFDKDKCDSTKVELKVILNGNESSDGFRHAYAIMVLWAKPKADDADAAKVSITAKVDNKTTLMDDVAANDGKTAATAWTWTVQPGAEVSLTARISASGTAQNMKWTDVASKTILSTTETVDVVAGKDGTSQTLSFYVENYDPNHKNNITAPATFYVKIVSKTAAAEQSGKLVETTGTAKDVIKVGSFNIDVDTNGKLLWNADITLPAHQQNAVAADIKYDFDVLRNGVKVLTVSNVVGAQAVAGGKATFYQNATPTTSIGNNYDFKASDNITVQITKVTFAGADIQYLDKTTGADITAAMVADGSAASVTVANKSSGTVKIKSNDGAPANTPVVTVKSGATGTVGTMTHGGNVWTGTFSNLATVDGTAKVVLEVDKSKLQNLVQLTLNADVTGAKDIKTTWAPADFSATENLTLAVTPAVAGEVGKDSAKFAVTATLAAGNNAAQYRVTIEGVDGITNADTGWFNGTAAVAVWSGAITKSIEIAKADVHVYVRPVIAISSVANTTANELTVTFNRPVSGLTKDDFKVGTGSFVINDVKSAGANAVTVEIIGTVADSDTITAEQTIKDAENANNTLTQDTITFTDATTTWAI